MDMSKYDGPKKEDPNIHNIAVAEDVGRPIEKDSPVSGKEKNEGRLRNSAFVKTTKRPSYLQVC